MSSTEEKEDAALAPRLDEVPRPTKLTPKVHECVVASIRAGAYAEQAAKAAGIVPSTYYDWIRRGEAGEWPFSEFSEAIRAGEAEAEVAAVTILREAAQAGDWRAAAHYLERRHPERWGRHERQRAEHGGEGRAEHGGEARPARERDAEIERLLAEMAEREYGVGTASPGGLGEGGSDVGRM